MVEFLLVLEFLLDFAILPQIAGLFVLYNKSGLELTSAGKSTGGLDAVLEAGLVRAGVVLRREGLNSGGCLLAGTLALRVQGRRSILLAATTTASLS